MESKAKFLGHSLHQQLVVFPLGLLATAVIFDLIHLVSDNLTMATVAYWMMAAGIVGALAAAPWGTIDWLAIPRGTRAKAVGAWHGAGNLLVTLLFIGSWLGRSDAQTPPGALALALGFAGGAVALATAWLGGELVGRLGVGVDDRAHLDAPNSLTSRNAGDRA